MTSSRFSDAQTKPSRFSDKLPTRTNGTERGGNIDRNRHRDSDRRDRDRDRDRDSYTGRNRGREGESSRFLKFVVGFLKCRFTDRDGSQQSRFSATPITQQPQAQPADTHQQEADLAARLAMAQDWVSRNIPSGQ